MTIVTTHPFAVTLGVGLKNPQAKRHPIYPRGRVSSLAYALQDEVDPDAESWWSPHLFKGDYRKKENWEFSVGFAVDLDYYAAGCGHSSPSPDVREALAKLTFAANFMHDTPRGAGVCSRVLSAFRSIAFARRALGRSTRRRRGERADLGPGAVPSRGGRIRERHRAFASGCESARQHPARERPRW
jgi:hypothetical protein